MNLNNYQDRARQTAIYPNSFQGTPTSPGIDYTIHGLTNEAGEVAGLRKKFLRGDFGAVEQRERAKKELGDVLWYLAIASLEFGFTLQDIAEANLTKLSNRAAAGTLTGDGDNR